MKRYRKRRRRRPLVIIKKSKLRKTQKLAALGVIFIFGLIMLILIIKLFNAMFFSIRININDVAAMRIPPKEITYIYEICQEQQNDPKTALTTYLIYNRFFPEKQSSKSKEQLQLDFFSKMDKIRKRIPEKQFNNYYALLDTIITEMSRFPIPISSENTQPSYIFGDTWSTRRDMCGTRNHNGADILDRENIPGRLSVLSITGGTVESTGKNGRGGMYLGVRTERGSYYLYDNFERLSENMEPGSTVVAGTVLGYMGNGGKTDVNQVKGRYPANIHIGIKVRTTLSKSELWINPYPFLRLIEDRTYSELANVYDF